jgi:hypothetical protein
MARRQRWGHGLTQLPKTKITSAGLAKLAIRPCQNLLAAQGIKYASNMRQQFYVVRIGIFGCLQ